MSQYSGRATNDTNTFVSNVVGSGNLNGKLSEIRSSITVITNSNNNFQSQINIQYQNYDDAQNRINEDIDSFSKPILIAGLDEADTSAAVYGHYIALLNSSKIALAYQLNQILGYILNANITVLQIEFNLTQCYAEINSTDDPIALAALEIQKQVYTIALTQALKTLAILQNTYNNCSAQLLVLDDQLNNAVNESNVCIQRFQKQDFQTIQEIRQQWREDKDAVLQQFRTSFENLLNCTVSQDSIGGLDDNQTTDGISLQWTFSFNLNPGETTDSKIPLLKTVIQNLVVVQAIVSTNSIQVTITSGSKRAAGDLSAQASVTSSPSSSSSTTNNPASYTPIIIGVVVGVVALVVIIVIIVVILKKNPGERV